MTGRRSYALSGHSSRCVSPVWAAGRVVECTHQADGNGGLDRRAADGDDVVEEKQRGEATVGEQSPDPETQRGR